MEGWKVERLEGLRGFVISPVSIHFHRAERRRREARRVYDDDDDAVTQESENYTLRSVPSSLRQSFFNQYSSNVKKKKCQRLSSISQYIYYHHIHLLDWHHNHFRSVLNIVKYSNNPQSISLLSLFSKFF